MIVKSLSLDFYRNFVHSELSFSPTVNLIYGENAQGKTNLLEAIAFLSTASSHRARYDKEMIQFDIDHGFISGEVVTQNRNFTLEAKLSRGGSKHLLANGIRMKTKSEFTGILQTVLFCPEDLYLIREGAVQRRRFLDDCICQLRPKYATALTEYRKLYEHKSKILKNWREKPSLLDTLDEFNLGMAQTGAVLIQYRAHFIRRLAELTPKIQQDFSGGREILSLTYETVKTVENPEGALKDIFHSLLAHQEQHRKAEIEVGQCLSGPHKDDLVVSINGQLAKTYASQGQTRTAALSLKLASREIFHQSTGEWPALLLDDVLSELDEGRRSFVLNRIQGGQVFITSCEGAHPELSKEGKIFLVKNGTVI